MGTEENNNEVMTTRIYRKEWTREVLKNNARYDFAMHKGMAVAAPLLSTLVLLPFAYLFHWMPYYTGTLLFYLFFLNPMKVSLIRFRLGFHTNDVRLKELTTVFLSSTRTYLHVVWVMLYLDLRIVLMMVTLILLPKGIKESFAQRLAPYLLAKDLTLSGKEAVRISREMMEEEKMASFLLDLSFFPHVLLSGVTFGLYGILYGGPFREQTLVALYENLQYKAAYLSYQNSREEKETKDAPSVWRTAFPVLVFVCLIGAVFTGRDYMEYRDRNWVAPKEATATDDAFLALLEQEEVSVEELLAFSPKTLSERSADALAQMIFRYYYQTNEWTPIEKRGSFEDLSAAEQRVITLLRGLLTSEDGRIWYRLLVPAANRLESEYEEAMWDVDENDRDTLIDIKNHLTLANRYVGTVTNIYHTFFGFETATIENYSDEAFGYGTFYTFLGPYRMSSYGASSYVAQDLTKESRLEMERNIRLPLYPALAWELDGYRPVLHAASIYFETYGMLSPTARDVIPFLELSEKRSVKDSIAEFQDGFTRTGYVASAVSCNRYLTYLTEQERLHHEYLFSLDYIKLDSGYLYNIGSRAVKRNDPYLIYLLRQWEEKGVVEVFRYAGVLGKESSNLSLNYS